MSKNYFRVIPRDLFNESKLLKCLGMISLHVHDRKIQGLEIVHQEEKSGFVISQDENTGNIFVENLFFFDQNGTPVYFFHPLNNKNNFPLVMEYQNEEYWPFNEQGEYQLADFLFLKK